ncbi:MAG: helix-turn-helix domain-containing protein [Elusimicrobia bacterium]|nr:helix-turn-helix domain-containing protein [Elusimicrobiota bacterium]
MKPPEPAALYDSVTGGHLLTCTQVAEYLDYHVVSIRRLVGEGSLKPAEKAGKTLLFRREDLDRFRATSAWASRKASIERPLIPPQQPPDRLEATVKLDFGLGSVLRQPMEPILNFSWNQIPLIRAEIDSKYGNLPFEIEVKSPDGGLWSISYEPPTWVERMWKKLKKGDS